jgi:holo-[acyl-carrier protein] synthase
VIVGVGVDLVQVSRLGRVLEGALGERFLQRVFTEAERDYCESHAAARVVHYAGRFAAKEAMVKALGAPSGLRWRDMEVLSEGRPHFRHSGQASVALRELGVAHVHLSLSHDGGMAVASVVLESS